MRYLPLANTEIQRHPISPLEDARCTSSLRQNGPGGVFAEEVAIEICDSIYDCLSSPTILLAYYFI